MAVNLKIDRCLKKHQTFLVCATTTPVARRESQSSCLFTVMQLHRSILFGLILNWRVISSFGLFLNTFLLFRRQLRATMQSLLDCRLRNHFCVLCPVVGLLVTASPASGLPNLTPTAYEYTFWTDAILVSKVTSAITDSDSLTPTNNLYVNWAVKNIGTTSTATSFQTKLFVDDVLQDTQTTTAPLTVGQYAILQNFPIGKLSIGVHKIKIITDSGSTVTENSETDNQYIKTITVIDPNAAPTVITLAESSLTSTTAQLNGTVNPNGGSTTYCFEFGTTTSYGLTTTSSSAGSGTSAQTVNVPISSLTPNTTYHFRLVAVKNSVSTPGGDLSFKTLVTPPLAPTATTGVGQASGATTAILFGTVNPNGADTAAWFEWGTTSSYGNSTDNVAIGSGISAIQQSPPISGLSPGVTYHFRINGQNSAGTTSGADKTFVMPASPTQPPSATTGFVINMWPTFATLEGVMNPKGAPADTWFEWGTTTAYGNTNSTLSYGGTGTSDIPASQIITGLTLGTRYHYRLVAQNTAGKTTGLDQTFILGGSTVFGFKSPAGIAGDPVNTALGSYTYQRTDLDLPGKGMPFVFERSYNSQDTQKGPLGFGWNHSFNVSITTKLISPTNFATIRWGDGRTDTYTSDGVNGFAAPVGTFDSLNLNGNGTYSITKKDQSVFIFDSSNRLASITDKNGNVITLSYSGGNLSQVTDTAGRAITFVYDGANHLIRVNDPIGRSVQFTYDGNDNLLSAQDLGGNITQYSYDSNHQMLSIIDPRGNTIVTSTYNDSHQVTQQFDAANVKTTYSYDESNRKTTIVYDANGLNLANVHHYDSRLRLTQETDGNGNSTYFTYDSAGNRTRIQDKNGNTTTFGYDSRGNVTSKTNAQGSVTTIVYDTLNNPLSRTDALTNTTLFGYDNRGNVIATTNALLAVNRMAVDAAGLPIIITNASGNSTTNVFDPQGNLTQTLNAKATNFFFFDAVGRKTMQIDANGHTNRFVFDDSNNLLQFIDAKDRINFFFYDANNNKIGSLDPRGATTTNFFDSKDHLVGSRDVYGGVISNRFDALDRKIETIDRNSNHTGYGYDAAGNTTSVTNALGQVTQFTFDPNGNQTSVTDAKGNITTKVFDSLNQLIRTFNTKATNSFGYDPVGHRVAITNANNQITRLFFDAVGQLTNTLDSAAGSVFYTYDPVGNRLTTTNPKGHTTTNIFDLLNRLIEKREPGGSVYSYQYDPVGNLTQRQDPKGQIVNFSYDANNLLIQTLYPTGPPEAIDYDEIGNPIRITDSLGTTTLQYDQLRRVTNVVDVYGKNVGYSYDANGNRTSITYPDGKKVLYSYDALNRMIAVTDWQNRITSYTFDSVGNLAACMNANGTASVYAYDAANRQVGLTNFTASGSIISSYELTLDAVGNHRQSVQDEPLLPAFTNQTNNHAYNQDDRLTSINGIPVSHDANGNVTANGDDTFTYDYNDRLSLSVIAAVTGQYFYDGMGKRVVVTTNGVTRRFVLDRMASLSQILCETDANGNITAYYAYGLGLISRITPAGAATYYHYDVRGSTVALTDESGTVTDAYAYSVFGKQANNQGTTANPFRYLGRYGILNEGNGLCYARARYFSPDLGRFLTQDPLLGSDGDSQSLNRYVYALNNPIRLIDISGLSPQEGKAAASPGSSDRTHQAYLRQLRLGANIAQQNYLTALKELDITYEMWGNIFQGIHDASISTLTFYASGGAATLPELFHQAAVFHQINGSPEWLTQSFELTSDAGSVLSAIGERDILGAVAGLTQGVSTVLQQNSLAPNARKWLSGLSSILNAINPNGNISGTYSSVFYNYKSISAPIDIINSFNH